MAAQHLAAILIQKRARGMLVRLARRPPAPSASHRTVAMSPMQRFITLGGGRFGDERGFRDFTATRLQAWYRGRTAQWAYALARFPVYHIAALQLQFAWKAHCQQRAFNLAAASRSGLGLDEIAMLSPRARAALRVQAAWRSYTNRRIFRYYRDLVTFRGAGDPAQMLRAINPGEAALLDAAMGASVRFRLGGWCFPPTIYYKVFTRRAVCDLNAFSPKNYALSRQRVRKHQPGASDGNMGSTVYLRVGHALFRARQQAADTRGWYQRLEHNGWRPVTAKVMAEAAADPVSRATSGKASSGMSLLPRPMRQQDREAMRRAKKREWMRKLYAQGLLQAKGGGDGGNDDGGEEMPTAEVDFDGERWEEEADDMFEWAAALDYDAYVADWADLGRTAASDAK